MRKLNKNTNQILVILLILLNLVVLLGQLWPQGAPPFARGVNVVFLLLTLGYFGFSLLRSGK